MSDIVAVWSSDVRLPALAAEGQDQEVGGKIQKKVGEVNKVFNG